MVHTNNPSTLGSQGKQITSGWQFESSLTNMEKPLNIALKHIKRYSTSHMMKDTQIKTVAEAVGKWTHSSLVGIESGNSPFKGEFGNSSTATKIDSSS